MFSIKRICAYLAVLLTILSLNTSTKRTYAPRPTPSLLFNKVPVNRVTLKELIATCGPPDAELSDAEFDDVLGMQGTMIFGEPKNHYKRLLLYRYEDNSAVVWWSPDMWTESYVYGFDESEYAETIYSWID